MSRAPTKPSDTCLHCGATSPENAVSVCPTYLPETDPAWRPHCDPAPPEDRGTSVWVWVYPEGWEDRFAFQLPELPMPPISRRYHLSVPIGWRLVPDPGHGVLLENIFGRQLVAAETYALAEQARDGFRLRD